MFAQYNLGWMYENGLRRAPGSPWSAVRPGIVLLRRCNDQQQNAIEGGSKSVVALASPCRRHRVCLAALTRRWLEPGRRRDARPSEPLATALEGAAAAGVSWAARDDRGPGLRAIPGPAAPESASAPSGRRTIGNGPRPSRRARPMNALEFSESNLAAMGEQS